MLPRTYRLPHSSRLYHPKSFTHPLFIIKYAPSPEGKTRFGIVVSKKVDKRATARNRMRRLLHTFIQERLSAFPKNTDYLFIVKKPFTTLTPDDINELQKFLSGIT